jgi:pantetheine-phosphate adenylyltransferase
VSKNGSVFIDGEEDLLVIPSVLLSRKKTAVVYGFASKGICLIEISPEIKKNFRKLLKSFRKGKFKKIALGGTFNKLHSGHRYFLSMAKYYWKSAIVGLCSDRMVKTRKKNFRNVQSFKERKRALENYFKRTGLKSKIVEINDIYGPAIKDKETEAILLTEETFPNGIKINKIRKKNKLKELHYIILPYLLDKTGKKLGGGKASSGKNKGVKPS